MKNYSHINEVKLSAHSDGSMVYERISKTTINLPDLRELTESVCEILRRIGSIFSA